MRFVQCSTCSAPCNALPKVKEVSGYVHLLLSFAALDCTKSLGVRSVQERGSIRESLLYTKSLIWWHAKFFLAGTKKKPGGQNISSVRYSKRKCDRANKRKICPSFGRPFSRILYCNASSRPPQNRKIVATFGLGAGKEKIHLYTFDTV